MIYHIIMYSYMFSKILYWSLYASTTHASVDHLIRNFVQNPQVSGGRPATSNTLSRPCRVRSSLGESWPPWRWARLRLDEDEVLEDQYWHALTSSHDQYYFTSLLNHGTSGKVVVAMSRFGNVWKIRATHRHGTVARPSWDQPWDLESHPSAWNPSAWATWAKPCSQRVAKLWDETMRWENGKTVSNVLVMFWMLLGQSCWIYIYIYIYNIYVHICVHACEYII